MVNLDINYERQTTKPQSNKSSEEVIFATTDTFAARHIGLERQQIQQMLGVLGLDSIDELIAKTVPPAIRLNKSLQLPEALSESDALAKIRAIAQQNRVFRSFIGMGYHNCITPAVILRNVLENPGWYTAYTPIKLKSLKAD